MPQTYISAIGSNLKSTRMIGPNMESLATVVTVILLVIYGSGLIAFGLAWSRNRVAAVISRVFAFVAMASGFWLGFTLMNANSFAVGGIPVLLGAASLVISLRRNR